MANLKKRINKDQITITINPEIYPLETVYGAAYVFLDKAYLRLDGNPKKEIIVRIKSKKKITKKGLENLSNDFLNELLNYGLRYKISKNNRKIREYIIGTALLSATELEEEKQEEKEEKKEYWQKDALGIAVPWEEKYGKK